MARDMREGERQLTPEAVAHLEAASEHLEDAEDAYREARSLAATATEMAEEAGDTDLAAVALDLFDAAQARLVTEPVYSERLVERVYEVEGEEWELLEERVLGERVLEDYEVESWRRRRSS